MTDVWNDKQALAELALASIYASVRGRQMLLHGPFNSIDFDTIRLPPRLYNLVVNADTFNQPHDASTQHAVRYCSVYRSVRYQRLCLHHLPASCGLRIQPLTLFTLC